MTKFNNIHSALQYLYSLKSGVADPKNSGYQLNRITKFLDSIGNPQFSYPVIHIGGTAGKGSTSIMTAKLLNQLGYKVGLHTSPFLVSINEKFQVVEENIIGDCSDDELLDLINKFYVRHQEYIVNNEPLTFYEAVISMVFEFFRLQKVDVAVIEVAMGGRLDATNVVNSDVAVLNSVGMDHMEFLGDTLEKIAWDKMHIIKANKKFVCGITIPNIVDMITKYAKDLNSSHSFLNQDFRYQLIDNSSNKSIFNFVNNEISYTDITLPLFGSYQVHNATLAIQAVYEFLVDKSPFNSEVINQAFENLSIRGRFDTISRNPLIIADGAHNELKVRSLVDSILMQEEYKQKEINLLIGFKQGKDVTTMIRYLLELKPHKIFLTEFAKNNSPNTLPIRTHELNQILESNNFAKNNIYLCEDVYSAYEIFQTSLGNNSIGLITGSLYLVGNIYKFIDLKNVRKNN
jgi:dihydrofolate synthase / folylpolyglutamate synthase